VNDVHISAAINVAHPQQYAVLLIFVASRRNLPCFRGFFKVDHARALAQGESA